MIGDELKYRIYAAFGHVPTADQEQAVDCFTRFMTDRNERAVMVMRGSAGTGKTSLAASMVRALLSLQQHLVLMAPTGRAAKMFSLYADHAAYTIHRRIYRQQSLEGGFSLNFNSAHDTLFIVDEASMVSLSAGTSFTSFSAQNGVGSMTGGGAGLLDDLIQFVYNDRNCRLMLIGDHAQLPPVGETESPALRGDVLRGYGLHVHKCTLNEVLRQSSDSGILYNATTVRNQLSVLSEPSRRSMGIGERVLLPRIRFQGFSDVRRVTGEELIETLASSYAKAGLDDTLVVTRSNKRANIYNQGIRNMVLGREDELCTGDQLMIVKNNYSLSLASATAAGQQTASTGKGDAGGGLTFLANGDRAVVRRVRNIHEMHGFRFAEVTMNFPDYDDYELTTTVMLDTLTSEAPALTREQQEQLYQRVMEDYQDIPLKADRLKKVKADRYYNALQIKFAYAATCHKAQGGQWAHVYVDQGYMTDDMLTPDYLHWLYTAFTRATEKLYLVNWPRTQTDGPLDGD